MATPIKFSREVKLNPRHILDTDEGRGPARDEMEMTFTVRASQGAVQLRIRILLTVLDKRYAGLYDPVTPVAVSSHFKRKMADWWLESPECDVLEQGHCFGDTGYSIANDAWRAFLVSEEDGWKFLEQVYREWRNPDGDA